jgi:SNW domain-containing protein 1
MAVVYKTYVNNKYFPLYVMLSYFLQVHINDNFAKFSEALYIADRHSREDVRQRALMQQKLAQKEKAAKEENLRLLAQRAREERAGIAPSRPTAETQATMKSSLAAYGSDSGSSSGKV